jgi:hypothetical protein
MQRVYVIVVNSNRWRNTIECPESVFTPKCEDLRVIVCDNGSLDRSVARIGAWAIGEIPAKCANLRHLNLINAVTMTVLHLPA